MTLLAAAQLGHLQVSIDSRYAAPEAVDRFLLAAPRLRLAADVDRRDRQTDGRTPDRYIWDPALMKKLRNAKIAFENYNCESLKKTLRNS